MFSFIFSAKNAKVANFLALKIKENMPYAPIPNWIRNYLPSIPTEGELMAPDITPEVAFPLNDISSMVEILTNGLMGLGISDEEIEESKKILTAKLSTSTDAEKIDMLEPVLGSIKKSVL